MFHHIRCRIALRLLAMAMEYAKIGKLKKSVRFFRLSKCIVPKTSAIMESINRIEARITEYSEIIIAH